MGPFRLPPSSWLSLFLLWILFVRESAQWRGEFSCSLYFHLRSLWDDLLLEGASKQLSLMTLPEVSHLSESYSQILTLGRVLPSWKPICVFPFSSIDIWHIPHGFKFEVAQKQTLFSKPDWKNMQRSKKKKKRKSLGHLNCIIYQSYFGAVKVLIVSFKIQSF